MILNSIIISICIWVISLVDLVMSEAVENLSNSVLEKLSTLPNNCFLILRPTPAATRAEKYPTVTEAAAEAIVNNSINPVSVKVLAV